MSELCSQELSVGFVVPCEYGLRVRARVVRIEVAVKRPVFVVVPYLKQQAIEGFVISNDAEV